MWAEAVGQTNRSRGQFMQEVSKTCDVISGGAIQPTYWATSLGFYLQALSGNQHCALRAAVLCFVVLWRPLALGYSPRAPLMVTLVFCEPLAPFSVSIDRWGRLAPPHLAPPMGAARGPPSRLPTLVGPCGLCRVRSLPLGAPHWAPPFGAFAACHSLAHRSPVCGPLGHPSDHPWVIVASPRALGFLVHSVWTGSPKCSVAPTALRARPTIGSGYPSVVCWEMTPLFRDPKQKHVSLEILGFQAFGSHFGYIGSMYKKKVKPRNTHMCRI